MRAEGARARVTACAVAMGVTAAIALVGPRALAPWETDWLLVGDRATNHLGWAFFRNARMLSWPLGRAPDYYFPLGASVALTDSIPLVAIPLRAVSAWLPAQFQYLGAWVLACLVAQALAAARLLRRVGADARTQVLGAALFVWFPALGWRFANPALGHATLCLHAVLLLAMEPLVAPTADRDARRAYALLALLCGAVHAYLAAMVLALLAAWSVARALEDRPRWRAHLAAALACAAPAPLVMFAVGMLGQRGDSPGGFGDFAAGLDALVNPVTGSWIVPGAAVPEGHVEGYSYLGLGGLALVALAAIDRARRGPSAPADARTRALIALSTLLGFASLSNVVTLGPSELFDLRWLYRPIEGAMQQVRATGRFMWVPGYALLLLALRRAARSQDPRARVAVALCAALQVVEALPTQARWPIGAARVWRPTHPAWRASAGSYRHLAVMPPKFRFTACRSRALRWETWAAFARLAAENRWTINGGYIARPPRQRVADYCAPALEDIRAGRFARDTVYVLTNESVAAPFRAAAGRAVACGTLDGYVVCVAADRDSPLRRALR